MQIATALQEYLSTCTLKPSTLGVYRLFIDKHIAPYFGPITASELCSEKIKGFADKLLECGLSNAKIKSIVGFMKKGLKGKYKQDIFSLDLESPEEKRVISLNLKEQKKLETYAMVSDSINRIGVFLCLYTGIKIGELCGLMWRDVCFRKNQICVSRTVQRIKNQENDSQKKTMVVNLELTGKLRRSIPLVDFLIDMLLEHKESSIGEYVISQNGQLVEPRKMQYRLKKLLAEAGLPPICFNALRHTFVLRALESDFDITALSEILGHASVQVTYSKYALVYDKMDVKRFGMIRLASFFRAGDL